MQVSSRVRVVALCRSQSTGKRQLRVERWSRERRLNECVYVDNRHCQTRLCRGGARLFRRLGGCEDEGRSCLKLKLGGGGQIQNWRVGCFKLILTWTALQSSNEDG